MVVKLSSFLSTSLAEGLDSALVTGIIQNTDVALDSGTTGNYIAQITAGDGITVLNGAAHEANATVRVDSATVATSDNTLTVTNKTFNLTNNTLTGTLGQFNAALNGATFVSTDGPETLTSKTLTSPTINTPQIVGPGSFSKITTLGLRDQTTNQFDLRVQSNSSTNLTDNRTLTVDVENVNRSVKLGGDLIIDKELRTAGDFNLLMNLTDSTNITLPTSGTVMQFDSNGASTITGAFTAGTLSGHYLGADSDVTELVTKSFVDNLGVDASTLGGRDSDYFLNYNNFTNTPAGSVALASLGVNAPSNPSNGQLWWDDSAGNLYVYYVDSDGDTQWVEAVPQLAAEEYYSTSGGAIAGNVAITGTGSDNALAISKATNNIISLERSNKSSGTGFFGVNVETNSQTTLAYDATGNMVIGSSTGPSTQAGFTQTMKFNGGSGFVGIGPVSDAEAPLEIYWNGGNVTGGTASAPVQRNQLTLTTPTNAYNNGPKMTWAVDWGGYIKTAEIGSVNVSTGNGYGGHLIFATAGTNINTMTNRGMFTEFGTFIVSEDLEWDGTLASTDNNKTGALFYNNGKMFLQNDQNAAGTEIIISNNIHSAGANCAVLQYRTQNTTEGTIFGDGTGIAITNVSDYRKKENITDATGCLDRVVSLRPVNYTYRSQYTTTPDKVHLGLIAHEVDSAMPNVVKGEKDAVKTDSDGNETPDFQALSYSHNEMITNLIGAIKELKAENDAMRARLDVLEG